MVTRRPFTPLGIDGLQKDISRVWSWIFTLLLWPFPSIGAQELVFVQALWRHGERNPINTIPTDTRNKPDSWSTGLGELTKSGISIQYKLGRALKKRYINFLDNCQLHKQLYLWSTDYNRTLMSAAALHSGLFNEHNCSSFEENTDIGNDVLRLWSPFPVHSVPNGMDQSIVSIPCPKYDLLNKIYLESSEEIKEFELKNKNFIRFVSKSAGVNLAAMNISSVMDPLLNTKIQSQSHVMPDWVNDTIYDTGLSLWNQSVFLSFKNVSVTKFTIGSLLWNIVEVFRAKVHNSAYKDLKFHGYSVHDSTINSLLMVMGAYEYNEFRVPPYSSCYLLELWKDRNRHSIKFFTLDYPSVSDIFIEKRLLGCPPLPGSCSFEDFIARNEPYFVKNVSSECRLEEHTRKNALTSRQAILIMVALIFTLLTLGCLILFFLIIKRFLDNRRRYDGYYRVQLDSMADGFLSDRMVHFKNGKIIKESPSSNGNRSSLVLMDDKNNNETEDESDGNNDL